MALKEFKLPDIGEGIAEGEIVSWKVKAGQAVKEEDEFVEVMTDKATVTITVPSFTGVWQPGTSLGTIVILPVSASRWPVSIRHMRQLATTDSPGCQQ